MITGWEIPSPLIASKAVEDTCGGYVARAPKQIQIRISGEIRVWLLAHAFDLRSECAFFKGQVGGDLSQERLGSFFFGGQVSKPDRGP